MVSRSHCGEVDVGWPEHGLAGDQARPARNEMAWEQGKVQSGLDEFAGRPGTGRLFSTLRCLRFILPTSWH